MPAPPTPYGRDVTGEARFRVGWGGRLVLQVRVRDRADQALGGDSFRWIDAIERDIRAVRHHRNVRKMEPLL